MTVDFSELILEYGNASFDCGEHDGEQDEYADVADRADFAKNVLESAIQALVKENEELRGAVHESFHFLDSGHCVHCECFDNHAPDCIVKRYEEKARGGVK